MPILLEDLDLRKAERLMCQQALSRGGSIVEAARLLGITRHALKRRMIKHHIDWPTNPVSAQDARSEGRTESRDHRTTLPVSAPPETF